MADETPVSPITAAEPPKADALSEAVSSNVSTLKLKPVIRKPVVGATQTALKPGLNLPPKPAVGGAGLKPGLKLPPKPAATVTALRPGLKLPPKPGAGAADGALKPGLKLPAKPVIRKPGAAASPVAIPKPVTATPPQPEAASPAAPASEAPVTKIDMAGVAKLPTVGMQAVKRDEELKVAEMPKPMEALKSVTQKLKGITQQIPAQAILHKTGIIADASVSDAQKQAAKSKTARISLSDAMGVAPVKNESAPMKTIRIKRPTDIPGATKALDPVTPPAPAAAEPAAEKPASESAAAAPAPTVTQRKTLKITRPAGGAIRPGGKFGVKCPAAPAVESAAPDAGAGDAVADIADIPSMPPPPPPMPVEAASDVPSWISSICAVAQVAACIAVGVLAWKLYNASITVF